VKKQGYLARRV